MRLVYICMRLLKYSFHPTIQVSTPDMLAHDDGMPLTGFGLSVPLYGLWQEAGVIMRALLKEVHVPSMSQGVRQRAFEVVFELLGAGTGGAQDGDEDRLGNMATELVRYGRLGPLWQHRGDSMQGRVVKGCALVAGGRKAWYNLLKVEPPQRFSLFRAYVV